MNFEVKEEVYKSIQWLQQNAANSNLGSIRKEMFSALKPLLFEENFILTKYQMDLSDKDEYSLSMMMMLPYDMTAYHKDDTRNRIGLFFHESHKKLSSNDIYIILKSGEHQKYQRTILLTDGIIKTESRREFFQNFGVTLELIDLAFLKGWLNKLETSIDNLSSVEILMKAVSHQLAKMVAKNPMALFNIEWRQLERLLKDIFEESGFDAVLTPSSKDGGKDIILECTHYDTKKSYILEIKHWCSQQKVGYKLIKNFIEVIINEKREKGIFVSTFGYTNNAFELLTEVERKVVKFSDKNKIINLCSRYARKKAGLWVPEMSHEELLLDDTY